MSSKRKIVIEIPDIPWRKIFGFGVVVAVLSAAGFYGFKKLTTEKVVAKIGDYQITAKDIERRNQVLRIFYPNETGDHGLNLLTASFQAAQIMKNNGVTLDEKAIRDEEVRIDRNSKDPATLAKIKAVFDGDMDAYRRVFILPTLAERMIYSEVFLKSPKIQETSLRKVEEFLQKLNQPGVDFSKVARESGLVVRKLSISPDGNFDWKADVGRRQMQQRANVPDAAGAAPTAGAASGAPAEVQAALANKMGGQDVEAAKFWTQQFSKMKVGDVYQGPVDQGESFLVVRYLGRDPKNKKSFLTEVVAFPKADYAAWLASEKSKL